MGDLVSGSYPSKWGLQALFGDDGASNQSNLPIRTNLEIPVFSGALVDSAAALSTGVMTAVPVPVDVGMLVTKVSVLVGATAGSTLTHQWGAIYSGTTVAAPPLIGQSTDNTAATITASARLDFTLATPTIITGAQAPHGYIWVAIGVTGTVPSLITTPCGAAAAQYRWFTDSPLYFCQTSGSAVGATAPATLIEASVATVAPVAFAW